MAIKKQPITLKSALHEPIAEGVNVLIEKIAKANHASMELKFFIDVAIRAPGSKVCSVCAITILQDVFQTLQVIPII